MNKAQFEHTIRAAGSILGDSEVLVIGSQAIHASIDFKLDEAERSIEVDISSLNDADGSKADLIDGSIGELSIFQDTFGYYAQGVTPQTATLPDGWRGRLIPYLTPGTNGVTAHCLEPHDLWISKAIAGRPKDREFCRALIDRNLIETKILRQRLEMTASLNPAVRKKVSGFIEHG
ncbi:MAG: hypothetical protein IIB69_01855 [Proteobacteria bacterium]|nr:hypothetical protein [Pseudomonadota bacterium]